MFEQEVDAFLESLEQTVALGQNISGITSISWGIKCNGDKENVDTLTERVYDLFDGFKAVRKTEIYEEIHS